MTSQRDERAQDESANRTFEVPAKLRVHALAKMLGATSREVIATLGEIGQSVRSAQSNITREVALEVVRSLRPERLDSGQGRDEGGAAPGESSRASTRSTTAEASRTVSGNTESESTQQTETSGETGGPSDSDSSETPGTVGEEMGARSEKAENRSAERGDGALSPAFAAPQAMFLAPESRWAAESADTPAEVPESTETAESEEESDSADTVEEGEQSEGASARRRRRRGRRGRGRGRGGEGESVESSEGTLPSDSGEYSGSGDESDGGGKAAREEKKPKKEKKSKKDKKEKSAESGSSAQQGGRSVGGDSAESAPENAEQPTGQDEDAETASASRRRRRRRRKSSGESESATREDDPPNTVVHVRENSPEGGRQEAEDEVRAIKGSTRLEAKRQRRRDGRDAGRRRAPVLSESEFLARRESVERKMVVRESEGQTQVAVLEDDILAENFVTSSGNGSLVGNVYLGRVQNVLPSMEAAFVDIGRGRNAVLYAGEVDWESAGLAGKSRRIEQALSTGDSVLVQVTKDPLGHKGARLTTQVSLPGRFLVYVPGGGATGISRKLPDSERKRLKEILKRIVPDESGVIIRTASEGTSEEAIDRDVRRLQAQWEDIKEKSAASSTQAPQLLYAEPDLLVKVVRDLFTEDFSSLTVQGNQAWETIESYVQHVAPDLLGRLNKHVGNKDVFTEYRVDEQIAKALDRKVWLPSGGYLVIDRTEAMTVIDVNTGKFTGSGGNLEETVTRNNLEAAEEVVRQLRLRDIGGIVVIDFIDMVLESNRDLVLRRLTECLGRDRTRHQVAEVTSLGLVQMTRKRVGTGLLEAYSSTCEHCRGRGVLVSSEPIDHSQHGGSGGSRKNKQRGKAQSSETSGRQSESSAPEDTSRDRGDAATEEKPSETGGTGKEEPAATTGKRSEWKRKTVRSSGEAEAAATENGRESTTAEPVTESSSNGSASAKSGSAKSGSAKSGSAKSGSAKSGSAKSGSAKSGSAKSGAAKSGSTESAPAGAAPAESAPAGADSGEQLNGQRQSGDEAAETAEASTEESGRSRRKVSRPTGSTGSTAQPVVVNPAPSSSDASSRETSTEPESSSVSAGPARRSRRRAAGRAAGPPVEPSEE
nr:translation initiation factor IF-2 N-terminal domain-containing protein [Actinopolyspora halophila]